MGGRFRFRSDSAAMLEVAEAACGGLAPHRFRDDGPELDVELRLLPRRRATSGREPPPVRTRLGERLQSGIMDAGNYVLVSPRRRRARVVASAEMLDHAYHLRYELVEFAILLLAARCQRLVPLHAACVGRNGRGVLLLGDSGAGKSTLALHSLLRGLDFLSEDATFVEPDRMLATGLSNFVHVQRDALAGIPDDAARGWITGSPVIRRRSGVEKFEADLRRAPGQVRLAQAPLELVATVILGAQRGEAGRAMLTPATLDEVAASIANDQAYARTQPGWERFERWALRAPAYRLLRGPDPASSVDALQRLFD
jgi:hypothetical protein